MPLKLFEKDDDTLLCDARCPLASQHCTRTAGALYIGKLSANRALRSSSEPWPGSLHC